MNTNILRSQNTVKVNSAKPFEPSPYEIPPKNLKLGNLSPSFSPRGQYRLQQTDCTQIVGKNNFDLQSIQQFTSSGIHNSRQALLSLNSSRDIQETQKVANDHHQGIRQQNLEKRKETTQTLGSKSVSRKLSQQHESQEEFKIEIMQGSIEEDDNLNIHYQRDETMIRRINEQNIKIFSPEYGADSYQEDDYVMPDDYYQEGEADDQSPIVPTRPIPDITLHSQRTSNNVLNSDPKRFEAFEDDEYDENQIELVKEQFNIPKEMVQAEEEFKQLTREEIKKMAEEIGEAMNQEYLEQDLSERRLKKSARSTSKNQEVGGGSGRSDHKKQKLPKTNQAQDQKCREVINRSEIEKIREANLQSNLSQYAMNLKVKNGRLSQPLDENSITQDIVSMHNNFQPMLNFMTGATNLISPTPNFDRPQSGQSSGLQQLYSSSHLANYINNNMAQNVQNQVLEDQALDCLNSRLLQDIFEKASILPNTPEEDLVNQVQHRIFEEFYQQAVSGINLNMYDKVIDMICSFAENQVVSQLMTQLIKQSEIEATVEQITERDRKSSKSLMKRKTQMMPQSIALKRAQFNQTLQQPPTRDISNQRSHQRRKLVKKQRPISASRVQYYGPGVPNLQYQDTYTVKGEVIRVYAKDILDYMIKQRMVKKGVRPKLQSYHSPTEINQIYPQQQKKIKFNPVKNVYYSKSRSPQHSLVKDNNNTNSQSSVYAVGQDIRAYFKTHQMTPSSSQKGKINIMDELRNPVNMVFKGEKPKNKNAIEGKKNIRPNSAVVQIPALLYQQQNIEDKKSQSSQNQEPVPSYDPNTCEVNDNYNVILQRDGVPNASNIQSNVTFSPPVNIRPQGLASSHAQQISPKVSLKAKKKRQPSQVRTINSKSSIQGSSSIGNASSSNNLHHINVSRRISPPPLTINAPRGINNTKRIQSTVAAGGIHQNMIQGGFNLKLDSQVKHMLKQRKDQIRAKRNQTFQDYRSQIPSTQLSRYAKSPREQQNSQSPDNLKINMQNSNNARPGTILSDNVNIGSQMSNQLPNTLPHMQLPVSVCLHKRPLVPKLKLRSRTPISVQGLNNNTSKDYEMQMQQISSFETENKRSNTQQESSTGTIKQRATRAELAQIQILQQLNSGQQAVDIVDQNSNLVPRIRKIADIVDSARKRKGVKDERKQANSSVVTNKLTFMYPETNQSKIKGQRIDKNFDQHTYQYNFNGEPVEKQILKDIEEKQQSKDKLGKFQIKRNIQAVSTMPVSPKNLSTLSPMNAVNLTSINIRDSKAPSLMSSFFDKNQPISSLQKAIKKIGVNTMAQYQFPGSAAAFAAANDLSINLKR